MIISSEKLNERRLSQRILLNTNLTIKSYANNLEINDATVVDISAGGMQFFVPADYSRLKIQEICSFIFDLPELGKSYILGEICYCREISVPLHLHVVQYGVKFIYLPIKTWNHIKNCCQNDTKTSDSNLHKRSLEVQKKHEQTASADKTLTTRTLALINVQIRLENGSILYGKVKDLNFGGIRLQLSEPIPVNTSLTILVSFEKSPFMANGICNWCENIGQETGLFLANISFNNIKDEQFDSLKSLMMKLATYMADSILKAHDSISRH